ncbi:hypothetical protein ACN47E_007698 [Coniothyrium glycines]
MHLLYARQNPLDDARNTLSSWDNCMAKNYCKWPVIVGIIVGSLILISVITCIARCICCGGGGGRSGHKRVKSEPTPSYPTYGAPPVNPYAQAHTDTRLPSIDTRPVNQQYRSNAMPSFGVAPTPKPERPQFATFDSTRAVVNDDALPAMPTWKDGRDVHVAVEEQPIPEKRGDVEMDRLNHNGSITNSSVTGMAAVPGARRSPNSGRSPVSPIGDSYGFPPGYQNGPAPQRNSPGPYNAQEDYRRGSPGPNSSLLAGGTYAQSQSYGHMSPAASHPQPQPYDSYSDHDQYAQPAALNNHQARHDPYDQRDYYDDHAESYHSPAPQPQPQPQPHYQASHSPYTDPYNGPAPPPGASAAAAAAAAAQRSYTPLSAPSYHAPSIASTSPVYPGQQTYNAAAAAPAYPAQQQQQQLQQQQPSYQAFQPSPVRNPVDASY